MMNGTVELVADRATIWHRAFGPIGVTHSDESL